MTHSTALDANVAAVNAAGSYAREIHSKLAGIFAPLIGVNIMKADGSLMAKYAKLIPEFPHTTRLHVYDSSSDYSLSWTVKACELSESGRDYAYPAYREVTVYVGRLRNKVLQQILNVPEYKTDYSAAEIVEARKAYEAAKKIARDAESALIPFGAND